MNHRCGHPIQVYKIDLLFSENTMQNAIVCVDLIREIKCFECLCEEYSDILNYDEIDSYPLDPLRSGTYRQKALAHTIRHLFYRGSIPCDLDDLSSMYWINLRDTRKEEMKSKKVIREIEKVNELKKEPVTEEIIREMFQQNVKPKRIRKNYLSLYKEPEQKPKITDVIKKNSKGKK
jgi:hypothetical protein